ncbi:MAG: hypothetical protein FH749_14495 [Firmicutes bacterium]|nr:hypothetical protein [Bacillota bacterium]
MTTKLWFFEALDTLFFRDGTPFSMGETDTRGIRSSFPPAMSTLQGAVRAALAMGQGWSPQQRDKWPEQLGSSNNLGNIRLQGPYLVRSVDDELEFLFPFPASVVELKNGFAHLTPDDSETPTDIKEHTRLLKNLQEEDVRGVADKWLTIKGMGKVLQGLPPEKEDSICSPDLWSFENRTGIKINRQSRTAEQGRLYFLSHVRPKAELRVAVAVTGVDADWHEAVPRCIPLGGEAKMAMVEVKDFDDFIPSVPELEIRDGKVRFTVTLLTPGHFGFLDEDRPESVEQVEIEVRKAISEGPLTGFGSCVTACVPKLSQVGGWDVKNSRPRALRPVVFPGSTWFYEVDSDRVDEVKALHKSFVGVGNEYGYGQILIGKWGC